MPLFCPDADAEVVVAAEKEDLRERLPTPFSLLLALLLELPEGPKEDEEEEAALLKLLNPVPPEAEEVES